MLSAYALRFCSFDHKLTVSHPGLSLDEPGSGSLPFDTHQCTHCSKGDMMFAGSQSEDKASQSKATTQSKEELSERLISRPKARDVKAWLGAQDTFPWAVYRPVAIYNDDGRPHIRYCLDLRGHGISAVRNKGVEKAVNQAPAHNKEKNAGSQVLHPASTVCSGAFTSSSLLGLPTWCPSSCLLSPHPCSSKQL